MNYVSLNYFSVCNSFSQVCWTYWEFKGHVLLFSTRNKTVSWHTDLGRIHGVYPYNLCPSIWQNELGLKMKFFGPMMNNACIPTLFVIHGFLPKQTNRLTCMRSLQLFLIIILWIIGQKCSSKAPAYKNCVWVFCHLNNKTA